MGRIGSTDIMEKATSDIKSISWILIRKSELMIRILQSSSKISEKNLDSYCFLTSLGLLSLKNDVNVPSKSNKQKTYYFCWLVERSLTKIAGSGAGSISQSHGSVDPDPSQNITDPQGGIRKSTSDQREARMRRRRNGKSLRDHGEERMRRNKEER